MIVIYDRQLEGQFNRRIDAARFEIVYAIVSESTKALNIPFFSKVNLRNADRRLKTFGYRVSLLKVQAT